MKSNSKYVASRREFMQITGAGALTAFSALRSDGSQRSRLHYDFLNPPRRPTTPDAKNAHPTLNLNGTWSVTALPLEAEGESGYSTFKNSSGETLAAQVPGEIHLDLMRVGRIPTPTSATMRGQSVAGRRKIPGGIARNSRCHRAFASTCDSGWYSRESIFMVKSSSTASWRAPRKTHFQYSIWM